MLKFNLNGITYSFTLFNGVSISINKGKENSEPLNAIPVEEVRASEKKLNDRKSLLEGWQTYEVNQLSNDLNAYLFIQKQTQSYSAWNLVVPVIQEKETNRVFQFGTGYFALEGRGGGLGNTDTLIGRLMHLSEKGIKVNIIPRVVDAELLQQFEYLDSGVKLSDLIENSIDLINYKHGKFEWIYKNFRKIVAKWENKRLENNSQTVMHLK
jgi:hypothetical protein